MKTLKICAGTVLALAIPASAIAHPGHGLSHHEILHAAAHAAPWLIALAAVVCILKIKTVSLR